MKKLIIFILLTTTLNAAEVLKYTGKTSALTTINVLPSNFISRAPANECVVKKTIKVPFSKKTKVIEEQIPLGVTIDQKDSSNSRMSFEIISNTDVKFFLIHLTPTFGENPLPEQIIVPATGCKTVPLLYLRNGPGEYKISIAETTGEKPFESSYSVIHEDLLRNLDRRDLKFMLPTEYIQSENLDIVVLAKSIVEPTDTATEKAIKIYQWVTANISYDTVAYFNNTYVSKAYDALITLERKNAVCEGYANLLAALHRAVGLRSRVIHGKILWESSTETWENAGGHAWNEVWLDGRWVSMDSTWDAGNVDFKTQTFTQAPTFKYFDMPLEEFEKTHRFPEVRKNN